MDIHAATIRWTTRHRHRRPQTLRRCTTDPQIRSPPPSFFLPLRAPEAEPEQGVWDQEPLVGFTKKVFCGGEVKREKDAEDGERERETIKSFKSPWCLCTQTPSHTGQYSDAFWCIPCCITLSVIPLSGGPFSRFPETREEGGAGTQLTRIREAIKRPGPTIRHVTPYPLTPPPLGPYAKVVGPPTPRIESVRWPVDQSRHRRTHSKTV
jgi:hypothetical protein